MADHAVVSPNAWLTAARNSSRRRSSGPDGVTNSIQRRRALPWVRVEKNYLFEGSEGKETLADYSRAVAAS